MRGKRFCGLESKIVEGKVKGFKRSLGKISKMVCYLIYLNSKNLKKLNYLINFIQIIQILNFLNFVESEKNDCMNLQKCYTLSLSTLIRFKLSNSTITDCLP